MLGALHKARDVAAMLPDRQEDQHDQGNGDARTGFGQQPTTHAADDQGWTSDPWTATTKDDGRVYGRGAAAASASVSAVCPASG